MTSMKIWRRPTGIPLCTKSMCKLWEEKLEEELPEIPTWVHHTIWNRLILLARWLLFSVITGGCLGLVGTFFGKSVALFFGIYLVYFVVTYVEFRRNALATVQPRSLHLLQRP